jgi:hypothetical protein
METRTYTIIEYADITASIASKLTITDKNLLRRSVSGTDRAVVSWVGKAPNGLGSYQKYTESEITSVLEDSSGDWYVAPYQP